MADGGDQRCRRRRKRKPCHDRFELRLRHFRAKVVNLGQTPGNHGYTVIRSRKVKEQMRPPVVVCLLPPWWRG